MDEIEITIIGAGVVGLAIAAELSRKTHSLVVVEKNHAFGQETSSHNSEVIHAGIYYSPNTLKAKLCLEGAESLYQYCNARSIPCKRCGKVIVASNNNDINEIEKLYDKGTANGVSGLRIIDKSELAKFEPNVIGDTALYSPNTGIIDTHSLMVCLEQEALASGAIFSYGSEVELIEKQKEGFIIGFKNENYRLLSKIVINSAGLWADKIAAMAGINTDTAGYKLIYVKGSYFSYSKISPVKMLVYPPPDDLHKSLGIHATIDMGGRLRLGPDAEFVNLPDYKVDETKLDTFWESSTKLFKFIDKNSLHPDMAGVRPRLKENKGKDFIIKHEADRDLNGFINLIGIESPGLTSCLAIAKHVGSMIEDID
ncbi:dehydrogenase [Candidatus Magnetoovum chiemensis]|nr:dehydrogenase [Candidatus Magnetoovum chiemensis]